MATKSLAPNRLLNLWSDSEVNSTSNYVSIPEVLKAVSASQQFFYRCKVWNPSMTDGYLALADDTDIRIQCVGVVGIGGSGSQFGKAVKGRVTYMPVKELSESQSWERIFNKLESLKRLNDGWNGYSAPAPTPRAIADSKRLLDILKSIRQIPARINSAAIGGVAITFKLSTRKAYIELQNAKHILLLRSLSDKNDPIVEKFGSTIGELARLASNVRAFLDE